MKSRPRLVSFLLLAAILTCSFHSFGQHRKTGKAPKKHTAEEPGIDPATLPSNAPAPPPVFRYVEQMPTFPGDIQAFIVKNMQYPASALRENIEGRVGVEFIVRKDGSLTDAKVVHSAGKSLDTEALRIISIMPKWIPAKQNGVPVDAFYALPLTFRLE